jgi:outer membrane autotransporter protein
VRPKTAAELHLGPNQSALFSVYGPALNADAAVATAVSAMGSETDLKKALNELLPDTSGANLQVALNSQDMAAGQIRRRLVGVAKNGLPDHALGDVAGFWGQAIGDVSDQSAHGPEEQGFTAWGLGIALGADMPVADHSHIGLSFIEAYHSADNNTAHLSQTQYDSTLIYLYGRSDIGSAYVQAIAGGGFDKFNQTRHVDIATLSRKTAGKWDGYQYGGSLEIGDSLRYDLYNVTPFVRGEYLKVHEDAYAESGGGPGIDLNIGAKDPEATIRGSVGFTATRDFPVYYDSYVEAEFRANYTREFTHSVETVAASFAAGGPTFFNASDPRAANRAQVGFGIAHKDSYSSVSLDYDAEIASGYLGHIIAVTARFRF